MTQWEPHPGKGYYLDEFGQLWAGPFGVMMAGYMVFEGYTTEPPFEPRWGIREGFPPANAEPILPSQAAKIVNMHNPETMQPDGRTQIF